MGVRASSVLTSFLSKLRSAKLKAGLVGFLSLILVSIFSSIFIPYDPETMFRFTQDLPPSFAHPLGTDGFGRDVLALLLPAIKNTILIGTIAALLSTLVSLVVGFAAGYFRNPAASLLKWFMDAFLAIPSLPFIILISTLLMRIDMFTVAVIIALFSWAGGARAIMAQALSIRERDFIQTLKLSGASSLEAFKDISLNILPFILATFVNITRGAMLTETGISILGLGRHQTTLGIIIYMSTVVRAAIVRGLWWWWAPPAILLSIIMIFLYLINVGFDEIIDPRIRGKR